MKRHVIKVQDEINSEKNMFITTLLGRDKSLDQQCNF